MEKNTKELTISRIFDAPRELVFKAWTDPELLAKWWGPRGVTNPECEVDAQVGGAIHITMLAGEELGPLAGQRWPMKGTFIELTPPDRIVFSNQAVDENDNVLIDGITTVIFEEKDSKTIMTLHVIARGISAESPQMLAGMNQGWSESIDKLTELLEKS
ncbi:MAG: SRPBCC domain-containing protein [Candidatus Saccharimonadia bacterium]